MKLKEIRTLPFAEFHERGIIRWKVEVREPIMDGERLLVVDVLKNEDCTQYRMEGDSFRIVCAKKSRWVKGITRDGKLSKAPIEILRNYWQQYFLVGEKEEAALRRFLGKGSGGDIEALQRWVRETAAEMERRGKQARGELLDEEYQLCPDGIPAGLVDFIRRDVLPKDKTLIYKRGNVRGLCYACGEKVRAHRERFAQNMFARCPNCGEIVHCVLQGGRNYKADYVDNVVIAQKGTDGQTVFFRQFQIIRDSTARWERLEDFLKETVRYAIRGDKTAKWQRESKYNAYYTCERYDLDHWTRFRDNRIYDNGFYFCIHGIEEVLSGTRMQYADLQGYIMSEGSNKNHIHFLEYHAKYPVVEFLWKAGYRKLVHQRIFGMDRENRNAIRWSRKTLQECFYFPLRFLKMMESSKWTLDDVQRLKIFWMETEGQISDKEVEIILKEKINITPLKVAMPYASLLRILKYITKQTERETKAFVPINRYEAPPAARSVSISYRDYLQECQQLGLPLTDREILFPRDLKAAHERTSAQISFEKNKAEQEKFQKVVDGLEKYAWQKGDFLIRPAREQQELSEEGQALHHCVGGYIQRMAKGETAIFFVRKISEPDKPFYTLELRWKEVQQCRTDHNASYTQNPAVKAFVDSWLEKVVKKGGAKKKKSEEDAA